MNFAALFSSQGTIGPGAYLATGVAAFVVKYNLDRLAARFLAHRPWMPWEYMNPVGTTVSLLGLTAADRRFLVAMSLIALPFIWLGVALTVKRLRAIGAPPALVILFFIPLVNLLFFLLLAMIPSKPGDGEQPVPRNGHPWGRDAALAVALSIPVCLGAMLIATRGGMYGLGLFVATPFCLGLISVLAYTWGEPRSFGSCVGVALLTCGVLMVFLLGFGMEGAGCLIMAVPLVLALAVLGAAVGYRLQRPYSARELGAVLLLLALYPPAVIGSEAMAHPAIPEFEVHTAIEVNAPPAEVWKHVVAFSQLPEPTEWIFRAGIAYPIRAEIHGRGPGAIRHCVFSTGPFVEPITIWDEPRLLEFSVTRNPPPMREWSPYAGLNPPHLDGFLSSHKGHFQLTPLPGGRTRLEGVTWYVHSLWPASYWRLWSDAIIHRIHLRVLSHVRREAERASREMP